jgi:hypothetical protein
MTRYELTMRDGATIEGMPGPGSTITIECKDKLFFKEGTTIAIELPTDAGPHVILAMRMQERFDPQAFYRYLTANKVEESKQLKGRKK